MDEFKTLARPTRPQVQPTLFAVEPKWQDYWKEMPSFCMGDARPMYQITVNVYTLDDLRLLSNALGCQVTAKTDSVTYPPQNLDAPSDWVYCNE